MADRPTSRWQVDGAASLSAAIHDASDPLVVMRRVTEQALALIPAAEGAVVELAHEGHLAYVCASGALAAHVGTRLRIEESLSGLAVRTGHTQHCEDCASDPRVDRTACQRVGATSMVCVPLRRGDQPIGVLKVTAARPRAFTAEDVAVLGRLAEFISAVIGAFSEIARAAGEVLGAQAADGAPRDGGVSGREQDARVVAADRPAHDALGEFVANVLRPGIVTDLAARRRVERIVVGRSLRIACQPIVELDRGELLGVEALARFPQPPRQPPDAWFREAEQVGLGVALQLVALRAGLELLDQLPRAALLAVNIGPDAILAPELPALLEGSGERIVIELTEHLRIDDYPQLREALERIRACGVRLAIDDTGAGFASLSHLINLAPDLIKLDRQFTRGIDLDPVRRALAQALVSFAEETGARVIAEGIETQDELEVVRQLRIPYGQGYFIGRPGPVATLRAQFPHLRPNAAGQLVDGSGRRPRKAGSGRGLRAGAGRRAAAI